MKWTVFDITPNHISLKLKHRLKYNKKATLKKTKTKKTQQVNCPSKKT